MNKANHNKPINEEEKFYLVSLHQKIKYYFSNFFIQKKYLFKYQTPLIQLVKNQHYWNILNEIHFSNLINNQQMQLTYNHNYLLELFLIRYYEKIVYGLFSINTIIHKNYNPDSESPVEEFFCFKFKLLQNENIIEKMIFFFNELLDLITDFVLNANIVLQEPFLSIFSQLELLKNQNNIFTQESDITTEKKIDNLLNLKKILITKTPLKLKQKELFKDHEKDFNHFYNLIIQSPQKQPWILATCYQTKNQQENNEKLVWSATLNVNVLLAFLSQKNHLNDLNFLFII